MDAGAGVAVAKDASAQSTQTNGASRARGREAIVDAGGIFISSLLSACQRLAEGSSMLVAVAGLVLVLAVVMVVVAFP